MVELCCVSVPGGWQTCVKGTEVAFGPVFNVIGDLWNNPNLTVRRKQI